LLIAVTLMMSSCKPGYFTRAQFEKMEWLEGTWSSTEQGITIAEIWKFNAERGFSGVSFIASERDTLYYERLVVKQGDKRTMVMESETGQVQIESSEPMLLIRLKKGSFTFKGTNSGKTVTYKNLKDQALQIVIREQTEESRTKYELKKQ